MTSMCVCTHHWMNPKVNVNNQKISIKVAVVPSSSSWHTRPQRHVPIVSCEGIVKRKSEQKHTYICVQSQMNCTETYFYVSIKVPPSASILLLVKLIKTLSFEMEYWSFCPVRDEILQSVKCVMRFCTRHIFPTFLIEKCSLSYQKSSHPILQEMQSCIDCLCAQTIQKGGIAWMRQWTLGLWWYKHCC